MLEDCWAVFFLKVREGLELRSEDVRREEIGRIQGNRVRKDTFWCMSNGAHRVQFHSSLEMDKSVVRGQDVGEPLPVSPLPTCSLSFSPPLPFYLLTTLGSLKFSEFLHFWKQCPVNQLVTVVPFLSVFLNSDYCRFGEVIEWKRDRRQTVTDRPASPLWRCF